MKAIVTLLLLLFYTVSSFAQHDSLLEKPNRSAIEIGFGFVHTRLIDEGFTHKNYLFRGTNPKLGLSYSRQYKQSVFNFLISASTGSIHTKQRNLPTSFIHFSVATEYLRSIKKITNQKERNTIFAGLQLSSLNYVLTSKNIFDNIDVISLHGLYLKINYRHQLSEKQTILLSYSVPAMVYTNQLLWNSGASIYTGQDMKNVIKLLTTHGQFYYFNLFNNVHANLAYEKQLSKNVDFTTRYAFRYLNTSVEMPMRLYSNELLLGLKFKF